MAAQMKSSTPSTLRMMAVALCTALALAACGKGPSLGGAPEPGDVAVAEVDGKKVWASDVKREAVGQGLIGEGEPLDTSSDLFRDVLEEVVDQKLLAAEAIKRKVDRQPLTRRRLAAARERILADTMVEAQVAGAVNDRAIANLYGEQLRLARRSDEIKGRQIVTRTAADGEAVRKQLAAGAAFETLAMDRSIDPNTRFNGGDLGYFTLDVMPAAYGAALKDAKVGDLVGPFQVEQGFAVVRVEDRRQEKPISLEQARPQIVRFLTYDEVRDLLERLRAKAKVKVLLAPRQTVPGAPREPASAPAGAPRPAGAQPQPTEPPHDPATLPGALPTHRLPPGGRPRRRPPGGARTDSSGGAGACRSRAVKPPRDRKPLALTGVNPAEMVGQTIERALDPLASVLKKAALARAERSRRQFEPAPPPAAAKPRAYVSPLAVPFPAIPGSPGSRSPPRAPGCSAASART